MNKTPTIIIMAIMIFNTALSSLIAYRISNTQEQFVSMLYTQKELSRTLDRSVTISEKLSQCPNVWRIYKPDKN